jgi:ATP-binding cassette subfamily F protein uup
MQFLANNERRLTSFLRKEAEWVKMNPQARSSKSKERLERFENLSSELKDLKDVLKTTNEVEISSIKSRIGKKTIIIENLNKSFSDKVLFKDFNYILSRFDRLGIVGENGCGKSTLFNLITNKLEPDSGTITIGETIKIGYFHQQMEIKNKKITPIEYVKEFGEYIETVNGKISAADLLDNYLITGSMQYMPIEKLSGGEIKRLQLLSILIQNPNVLFLDEPTNDLDIVTLSKLEDFLETFTGAIVVVSHDRYFLDKVTNHLLYYKNSNIHMYNGKVTDLIKEYKKEEEVKIKEKKVVNIPRFTSKEKKEFDNIEKDIENIENEIARLKKEIDNFSTDYVKILELQDEISLKEMELLEKLDRWEYLSKINEEIENYRKGKFENV